MAPVSDSRPRTGHTAAQPAQRPFQRPRFRIHRVTCPKCGRAFWFTLFCERNAEEVAWARLQHERRLMDEPCELHADAVEPPP